MIEVPEAFLRCVRRGGKVTTQKLSGGRYRRICRIAGKIFFGHIKKKKGKK